MGSRLPTQFLPTPALIGGALAAALYYVAFALGLGFVFLFIPTLPIFWLSLSRQDAAGLHASLLATLILAVVGSPAHALFFLMALGLPAFYVAHESLKFGQFEKSTIWFPMTVIMTRLATVFCFLLLAITLYYAGQAGGLPQIVASQITAEFSQIMTELPEGEANILQAVMVEMSFLVMAISGWMWLLSLYVHGWIANRELVRRNKSIRPSFRISPFPPQNWLLSLLLITAISSLIGGESMAFWGKASLVILLLPHFLLGLALIHERCKTLPNGNVLLFFLYFLIFVLLWVIVAIALYGAYYHIRLLNKYLSAGGTSSKN